VELDSVIGAAALAVALSKNPTPVIVAVPVSVRMVAVGVRGVTSAQLARSASIAG
jgi:hypothetical protein